MYNETKMNQNISEDLQKEIFQVSIYFGNRDFGKHFRKKFWEKNLEKIFRVKKSKKIQEKFCQQKFNKKNILEK